MPTIEVNYTPNARQCEFHACAADEAVYGGAKGGGKSCGLAMEALAYGCEYPGAKIYLFRETFDDLEANLINEAKEKWPSELYTYNEGKHIATLYNGSRVFFRYIRNMQDAKRYQGRSMDFVGVDELTNFTYEQIQVLLSCLRSPKGYPPRFRGTCNPGGIGHAWVKKRYIEATNYGETTTTDDVTGNTLAFIPAQVYDNDILMKNDPAYVKRLENLPEDLRRAYLLGDWDVFVGQYFSEWNRELHIIEPFPIPEHWVKIRAMDEGYNDPFVCLWLAFDENETCYVYREFVQTQLLSHEQAKAVLDRTSETIRQNIGDTSFWNKSKTTGEAPAEIFARCGLPMIQATKERVNGWRRVRDYLHVFEDTDRVTGEKFKNTHLKIFKTCTHLIEAIPSMVTDEKELEDIAPHPLDHTVDALRYGLMSRPPRTRKLPDETPKTPEQIRMDRIKEAEEKHLREVMKRNKRMGMRW
ncbi:hypothetical protein SD70_27255 [Gordoniibacillus kamchatkensis]|uniref:Phage terminase large subunit N-terminal domain-containing protein n=1 Tax=Gordoniibacillus kamchatkensis TaxID=1590651 RepID=A0ABR5ABG5_9BACL|nr:phage terminase large subunit [Paenibacillus sp. VKM B-2647]KIL38316.1 hypothetical protein SD70_27255 [Paenibacillus sp. VKM B-2647]